VARDDQFQLGGVEHVQQREMRETVDGFQDGLQTGGRMVTNLRYADDITLLATSEAELQELVDRLDRVSRKYSLLINVDKTNVMASDGIACRILIHNEQLKQVDTFPYLGSLITEDSECTTESARISPPPTLSPLSKQGS